ncbi:branched-chain amino acid ABC transporter permease/ATP-binding protein [Pseudonocardia ailaonensis]|uniref:Branched-chain amino acid ABC transporter permease/ATP-binding protein n=1 Tax=Pseudonocardia ailaonensis TaxID=367279 RepID=A0ABN2N436_9PSEU
MNEYLQLAVLGLGTGALYSLLSSGILLIYRASGVLNFAQGAIAMVGAYVFYELHVENGMNFALAALISVVLCGLLGGVLYQVVMRPLRRAAPITRVIATLGLLTVLVAGATLLYAGAVLDVPSSLPTQTFEVFGLNVPQDRLWLLLIAAVITVATHLASKHTRFGLVTRGVAENETSIAALGESPDKIATINWMIGAALAGLAGTLIAPIVGLTVDSLIWLVVPALAAALFGRLDSFPLAFLGAIILGVGQALLSKQQAFIPGLTDLVPLALILIAMVVWGQATQTRGVILEKLPSVGSARNHTPVLLGTLVVMIVLAAVLPENWAIALGISAMAAVVLLSVLVVTGYGGQVSLAQMAIAGVGALVAGRLVSNLEVPFPLAMLVGVVAGALLGGIFGLPSLRMRGPSLAIVTLALGVAVNSAVFKNSMLSGLENGFPLKPQSFFGLTIDPILSPRTYTVFVVCWVILLLWLVGNLRKSPAGRRMLAVRENERAAAALGISVSAVKLYTFVVGSVIAAIGGVLFAFATTNVQVSTGYDPVSSVAILTFGIVGGVGALPGPFLGAQLYPGGLPGGVIAEAIGGSEAQGWLVLIGGIVMVFVLVTHPEGIADQMAKPFKALRRNRSGAEDAEAGAAAAGEGTERAVVVEAQTAMSEGGPELLRVSDVHVSFGAVRAVAGANLEVRRGEVLGLIGPNGSGKTTLTDAISGFNNARGSIYLDDEDISTYSPTRRARAGLARSFQSLDLFDEITVEENLRAASDTSRWTAYFGAWLPQRWRPLSPVAARAVRELDLEEVLAESPKNLSYGQRRLTAIARTLASGPSFVLLDEPAAGLSALETAHVSQLITRMAKEWNVGVLVVEHDMSLVMASCDRIAVLNFGKVIAQGSPIEVRANAEVRAAYLGDDFAIDELEADLLLQAETES